eukprot:10724692-Lingulodinium_polyedra.AAC.1
MAVFGEGSGRRSGWQTCAISATQLTAAWCLIPRPSQEFEKVAAPRYSTPGHAVSSIRQSCGGMRASPAGVW